MRPRPHSLRLVPFVILLIALALRIAQLDAVTAYYDFAMPHGQGIQIVEALGSGRWGDLPLLGIGSSTLLANPPGASYFWAFLALFERDPYIANAVSVLLSVVAVAMVFDLGRRLFGRSVGCAAALLVAASPWAITYARGTWVQGQLEFASIAAAWLVWRALDEGRARRLLAGLVFTAVMMQTYVMALFLIAQVAAAGGITWLVRRDRALARRLLTGLATCLASGLLFAGLTLTQGGTLTVALQRVFTQRDIAAQAQSTRAESFELAVRRILDNVSGRGFGAAQAGLVDDGDSLLASVENVRAGLIEALVALGVGLAAVRTVRGERRAAYLTLLMWLAIPIALATALNFGAYLREGGQQMLLAQPAVCLLAALPVGAAVGWSWRSPAMARSLTACLVVLGAPLAGITALDLSAAARQSFAHPLKNVLSFEPVTRYPLRIQREVARQWRGECAEVAAEAYAPLLFSLNQSTHNLREQAARFTERDGQPIAGVWSVRAAGGTCVTRPGVSFLPYAERSELPLPDDATLITYRSRAIDETQLRVALGAAEFKPLSFNLGWTLLALTTPSVAAPGQAIGLTHAWRIDSLPGELYLGWDYTLFATLIGPDGQKTALADHLPLPAPSAWRPGDFVLGEARLSLPQALAPGPYRLELSVFDDGQKKNAVFFDPAQPSQPIVVLERALQITR